MRLARVPIAGINEAPKALESAFYSLAEVLRTRKPRRPIPTGIAKIDELTGGGFSGGDSVVLASGPGGLKTTILTNIAETMAGPATAICVVAWDERWTTVAAKLGARFGEPFTTLDSEHPVALDSLAARLARRDAFIRFVDPTSLMSIEDFGETFDRIAPKDRVRIYVVDLLQLMESRTLDERDTEVIELKKLVEALLHMNRKQEAILLVASETTKAAISLEAVEANPLGVFAGSRKMASRFDLPIAMAKTDDVTVKAFIAKNRLGPAGTFLIRLDPSTWRVESIDDAEVRVQEAQASTKKRRVLAKEILKVLPVDGRGISRRTIQEKLKARNVAFRNGDPGPAIQLLAEAGFVTEAPGPNRSLLARLASGVDAESAEVTSW